MNKTIGMLAAAGGLSLCMAATPASAQESPSSTLSKFFGSVVSGAGSEIGSTAVGWALSAIGVSNSTGQALADLTEIITLLKDIEAALQTIETDFDNLACETAQDSTALQNATTAIGGLYSRYTQFVNDYNTDQTIPPWGGTQGVQQWLSDIFEPETGVQAQLIAIQNNLIEAGNTGVIFECVKFITDQYNSSDGPKTNVFDDAYYAQVQQLTNFYYLYQSYAAALLVEAWHVQACLDSDGTTTGSDRNCTFDGQTAVTPQSGVTSDMAYNICNNPPNTRVAGDCTNAQTALTNLNDNGAYDGLSAQLIQAGAPYTNDVNPLVAKGWFTDAVFVRSLEDFTNNATANGSKIQSTPCATPLTSADPCGFTVGAYNLAMPNDNKITYGGYNFWTRAGGGDLKDLLETYNNKTSGNTSSTLGAWMNSVGFKTAQNKIVLTGNTGSNWGYGSSKGTATVCFMDTSLARSASDQPWCDGTSQSTSNLLTETSSGGCGDACVFTDYKEASFTGGSVASGFYTAVLDWTDDYGLEYDWKPAPGWLANQQGNSKFHHFHWPAFAINSSALGSGWCTVRAKGTAPQDNKNPGGVLTMCGADLQAWLDNVLPKPDVSVGVGMAKNDSNLLGADRNRNDGFHPALSLVGKRGVGFNSVVVEFDQTQVFSFLDEGTLSRATLVLTIKENHGHWGRHGQWVVAYPLLDLFMEGNGNAAAGHRGTGTGVTWNCAQDLDISNDVKECLFEWTGVPRFRPRWNEPSAAVKHFDHTTGAVEWDVTQDAASGITAWILQKTKRRRGGGVDYYSRQGARAVNDTNLAPTLILER